MWRLWETEFGRLIRDLLAVDIAAASGNMAMK